MYGVYPEGVTYAILLMNIAAPLIDRYTRPKVFGEVKKNA
jgi:electron transport complex protein RnfD